jgi:MerR family transcriptional regulator, glutamine synthetase repressor
MSDTLRRNLALFPIGIVQKLTELTARQIRYYEQNGLVKPVRTEGNQRLFSFNDVERLLEIKKLIDQGLNISGIKRILGTVETQNELPAKDISSNPGDLSEQELHDLLKQELMMARTSRPGPINTLIQGELSRFFH